MCLSRRSLAVALLLGTGLVLPPTLDAQGRRARRGDGGADAGERTLEHGGRQRAYVVRAPRARGEARLPVVIMLHGGGGDAANAERMSGFTALVEREGLIAVYPNGTSRLGDRLLTWNAGHCCGFAMDNTVDDVGFIDAMLDALAREYRVDERRIYVTGMSNGAMMTHRLGRELRHRPAAIAPVVGAVFGDEAPPASAVAAVIFNGLKDASVPANGGLGKGLGRRAWDGVPPRPNVDQGTYWARAAGCGTTPTSTEDMELIHWTWPCASGAAVELYQLKDNGHAWPGGQAGSRRGDRPGEAVDATEVMWAFFKAHPGRGR
ncbi:MAG: polyhydroxybutyrate depolymerase [Cytophagaceae bacterium]|nr:polyhydroxybutyrate depolymerase [Gemmatimonadaceae bacterium]